MGEDDQRGPGAGEGGVFGNLPSSRPGTRSPRRERSAAAPEPAPEPEPVDPGPAREAEPEPPDPEPAEAPAAGPDPVAAAEPPSARAPEPDQEGPEEHDDEHAGGLEDLAWAGIAAAAEAATIGVRLASRAMDALRGSGERR